MYKLIYFDIRARGEPIRLILKYANVPFEDFRIKKDQWSEIKPTTPAGKVPVLEFDGNKLYESYAIARFLARKYGLAGKDELEEAKVDAIADQQKDFFNNTIPWFVLKWGMKEGNEEELRNTILIPQAEYFLPLYQKYLDGSGSGFLVKSGLTWADFFVSEFLISLRQVQPNFLEDKYPKFIDYINRIKNLPQLKEYYSSRKE